MTMSTVGTSTSSTPSADDIAQAEDQLTSSIGSTLVLQSDSQTSKLAAQFKQAMSDADSDS